MVVMWGEVVVRKVMLKVVSVGRQWGLRMRDLREVVSVVMMVV